MHFGIYWQNVRDTVAGDSNWDEALVKIKLDQYMLVRFKLHPINTRAVALK